MDPLEVDPHLTDPPLLKNHSYFKSYKTSYGEYPDIRVFFRQHAKAEELYKSNGPLPLLVFLPGLGGSVAQFHPLLSSLVDLAPCLSMDHPGGGRSSLGPTSWEAYTPRALAELQETIIEDYRDNEADQTVVLIGHSMGTAQAAWLANTKVKHSTELAKYVVGLIAICPVAGPMDEQRTAMARKLMWIPGWIFDLWRLWSGWGGPNSSSVARFVGPEADADLKLLQYRFNQQSRTAVFRRMFYGAQPLYKDGKPEGVLAGPEVWAQLEAPIFLIAGEKDHLTPPEEVNKIKEALARGVNETSPKTSETEEELGVAAAAPVDISIKTTDNAPRAIEEIRDEDFLKVKDPSQNFDDPFDDPSTPQETPQNDVPAQSRHPRQVLQSFIMPAPANHAMLYMPRAVRAMAGLISDFLATNVTGRLSLAWQLQYLSKEGKWDVKNLNKWKSVNPVSDPIGPAENPIFRAMKTLREADDVHCPSEFVAKWGSAVSDVVDISKDQPVYDPRGLERADVHYHKFPTVSKVPPPAHEIDAFIKLIDDLRKNKRSNSGNDGNNEDGVDNRLIGVHCHYGFNRTGYFIVSYLVERCGYSVQEAIEAFAKARPNGIRHSHFLDRLYVRYDVGKSLSRPS